MYARIARHWGLMNAMAGRAGVDLGMEYLDGRIARETLRGAVFRCAECGHVSACEAYLAGAGGPYDAVPGYCLNRVLFDRLRPVES